MGKYRELSYGITQIINSMIALGLKKSDMIEKMKIEYLKTHDSLKGLDPRKNEFIRSVKSIDAMRQEQRLFCNYCYENGIKKFEHVDRYILEKYLIARNDESSKYYTRSAWSISKSVHFVNKIWQESITKRELALPSRLQKKVICGRGGLDKIADRPYVFERNAAQIIIARATGCRRASITRMTVDDFNYSPTSKLPISCRLLEKGGKERLAYVLPEYQEKVNAILNAQKDRSVPLFYSYDKDINNHHFRHEYAESLLKQLMNEHQKGLPYFEGEFEALFRLTQKEQHMVYWREKYPVSVCGMVSSVLGHNRIEILKSYIY